MSYRPICDTWLLARPKVKYYGAYPNGFLQRARTLLGCSHLDAVLHVCGGKAREYPNNGFGMYDKTIDLNPDVEPDFLMDVTKEIPMGEWKGILIDPPYTLEDASKYGKHSFPEPNALLKKCMNFVEVGRCVGMLHYVVPAVPKNAKEIALIAVIMGNNNRIRCFSVFRRTE